MSVVKVEEVDSAEEFLAATLALRNRNPVLTNLLGSIAMSVTTGRSYERCRWWIVEDQGQVVAAALRTAPHLLVLSPMTTEAARALVDKVTAADPDFPGVSGPVASVDAFTNASGLTYSPSMHELIYVLGELKVPRVNGSARATNASDQDLIPSWYRAFIAEAGLIGDPDNGRIAGMTSDGKFMVWEVDGEVVSYAGNAPIVETGPERIGRVGPVYTPPEKRRRGFGAAVTAAVTRRLQEDGCTTVMLYTDANNPISNSIYRQIGYEQVFEWIELKRMS